MFISGILTLLGERALNSVPSGTAYRSMGRPSASLTTSSSPQNIDHGHPAGSALHVNSAQTLESPRPFFSRILLVLSK